MLVLNFILKGKEKDIESEDECHDRNQKEQQTIKNIYICMLFKNHLKYEVSINTSIHLGMQI